MTTIDRRGNRIASAAGMVCEQVDCTIDQALLRMQEYGRAMRRTLEEVAVEVLERGKRFTK